MESPAFSQNKKKQKQILQLTNPLHNDHPNMEVYGIKRKLDKHFQ